MKKPKYRISRRSVSYLVPTWTKQGSGLAPKPPSPRELARVGGEAANKEHVDRAVNHWTTNGDGVGKEQEYQADRAKRDGDLRDDRGLLSRFTQLDHLESPPARPVPRDPTAAFRTRTAIAAFDPVLTGFLHHEFPDPTTPSAAFDDGRIVQEEQGTIERMHAAERRVADEEHNLQQRLEGLFDASVSRHEKAFEFDVRRLSAALERAYTDVVDGRKPEYELHADGSIYLAARRALELDVILLQWHYFLVDIRSLRDEARRRNEGLTAFPLTEQAIERALWDAKTKVDRLLNRDAVFSLWEAKNNMLHAEVEKHRLLDPLQRDSRTKNGYTNGTYYFVVFACRIAARRHRVCATERTERRLTAVQYDELYRTVILYRKLHDAMMGRPPAARCYDQLAKSVYLAENLPIVDAANLYRSYGTRNAPQRSRTASPHLEHPPRPSRDLDLQAVHAGLQKPNRRSSSLRRPSYDEDSRHRDSGSDSNETDHDGRRGRSRTPPRRRDLFFKPRQTLRAFRGRTLAPPPEPTSSQTTPTSSAPPSRAASPARSSASSAAESIAPSHRATSRLGSERAPHLSLDDASFAPFSSFAA
ncbi:hypothetical protein JCM10212_000972 [Sporobolomyces blumeae]